MKEKAKGFKFTDWVVPVSNENVEYKTIFSGNFVMELVLPNALKIDGFRKLKYRLDKWIDAHGGKVPDRILCTKKQYCQYVDLFLKNVRPAHIDGGYCFQGIQLIRHGKK